jgi:hypothetical protein
MMVAPLLFTFCVICTIFALFYPPIFFLLTALMCLVYISSLFIAVEKQRSFLRTGNRAFQEAYARVTDSYLNFRNYQAICERGDRATTPQRGHPSRRAKLHEFLRAQKHYGSGPKHVDGSLACRNTNHCTNRPLLALFLHLYAKAKRPHISPYFIDMSQALPLLPFLA